VLVKNTTHIYKLIKDLNKGDLYYRREFERKKMVKIDNLCKVIEGRK